MNLLIKVICVGALALTSVRANPIDEDTYLQALQNSQHPDFYGPPSGGFNYEPAPQPSQGYNYEPAPQPSQGYNYEPAPPIHQPQPEYVVSHPPVTFYHDFPKHHSVGHYQHQPSLHEWLFNKIKLKLNLFTLGKILLKLIIFKKIVKFIAVICLLLFLPKLGALFKMDEPAADASIEAKEFTTDRDDLNERLEESARQVLKSLETYSKRFLKHKV